MQMFIYIFLNICHVSVTLPLFFSLITFQHIVLKIKGQIPSFKGHA